MVAMREPFVLAALASWAVKTDVGGATVSDISFMRHGDRDGYRIAVDWLVDGVRYRTDLGNLSEEAVQEAAASGAGLVELFDEIRARLDVEGHLVVEAARPVRL